MISGNKTINKALDLLIARREKLFEKKQSLRDWVDEKYPYETHGCKGMSIFEQKSKDLDNEIKLLSMYISGMYDLIEIIEKK